MLSTLQHQYPRRCLLSNLATRVSQRTTMFIYSYGPCRYGLSTYGLCSYIAMAYRFVSACQHERRKQLPLSVCSGSSTATCCQFYASNKLYYSTRIPSSSAPGPPPRCLFPTFQISAYKNQNLCQWTQMPLRSTYIVTTYMVMAYIVMAHAQCSSTPTRSEIRRS